MASYDSDTSSEDGNEVSTNVTLGYCSSESTGDEISHVGGSPVWLDDKTLPSADLVKCKVCGDYMSLLLQLHADLQQQFPNDHRRLHVWCCRKRVCSKKPGSIRSFREVKKGQIQRKPGAQHSPSQARAPIQGLGSQLFGGSPAKVSGNSNPFSTGLNNSQTSNPFSNISSLAAKPPQTPNDQPDVQPPTESFADKLKIGTTSPTQTLKMKPSEPWPSESEFPPPFPFFYVDAEAEYLDRNPPARAETSRNGTNSTFDSEDIASSSTQADKDAFESSLDRTFQKFSDIIAQNSEQVLRYEFRGTPLLYSSTDNTATHFVLPHGKTGPVRGLPRCESCGAQRVFEMQLVPGLIYEVEKDDDKIDLDAGMEWGTIIVGTCANNCGDEQGQISFKEEWTGVQWEERVAKK